MSTIRTTDTRTVRASVGNDRQHITVADLLKFADHLRDIDAPAGADVYRLADVMFQGPAPTPVALHVSYPRDTDAPKVAPPRPEPAGPDLHHVTEYTVSTRTQGRPPVYVRAHGPGGIWHVETGKLARTLRLETDDLVEALDYAHKIATGRV
ncbi:hypothetical protein [Nocardiopsis tropica]|uniref:Uncharacterized protein n=1 Tax=Nocardiopsis tropica TaxID=109330 RepID=A0ABU7KM17_9ACTN|nr:hypothetical protein [Nocardiopsis umidischolae]MEE2050334.1 hypothetical protein [Nocardiopsis umidischolae]